MDQQERLLEKAELAWDVSWQRFFRQETNLFYDYLTSFDPERSQSHLPTVDEIQRQYPNARGWGTGMEDSAISAGIWMTAICARYDATGDEAMRGYASKVFDGMKLLMSVGSSSGFVARSVSPEDKYSHYKESSRDQYTHYVDALWRFYESPLSGKKQREEIKDLIVKICNRLDKYVKPGPTSYSICQEDGSYSELAQMWDVEPHEWARLPMIYLIGYVITDDGRWYERYKQYAWQAALKSLEAPIEWRTSFAHLQAVVSLLPLYAIERDPDLRQAWQRAIDFYTERTEGFTWQCLNFSPYDLQKIKLDWRTWPMDDVDGMQMPSKHIEQTGWDVGERNSFIGERATVRAPGEAWLTQFLWVERPVAKTQVQLFQYAMTEIDFDKCLSYGPFYFAASYWLAVRRGLLTLPGDQT